MASFGTQYPDYLNPFDDDDDETANGNSSSNKLVKDDYPDYLDPFGTDEVSSKQKDGSVDDYDDSLNPFGDDTGTTRLKTDEASNQTKSNNNQNSKVLEKDEGNPFADEIDEGSKQQDADDKKSVSLNEQVPDASITQSLDSLEPPKPLPRTKSLLKKEQAHRKRLEELQHSATDSNNHIHSLQSTASSTTSTSSSSTPATTTTAATEIGQSSATIGTFQRRKNKRIAPPVPINFKRQVSGSLNAIEEELNEIGDKLAIIDKESTICQATLTTPGEVDDVDLKITRSKFIELIKRRNSIVRRQKELMYKKRELKLDQLHSDIEYELRMIGNKQLSSRTEEDDTKEKELLKKLVEIVEEKNDIVENLNKDTSCDTHDIEEAFKRLNIIEPPPEKSENGPMSDSAKIVSKGESCDKRSLAKLSKIATLLPKGGTIKLKRKRLFKKTCDSKPIER